MSSPKQIAIMVHEAIDEVTTIVEGIHRSIAEAPLRVAQDFAPLETPVDEWRAIQNRSIGAVYDLVRQINGEIGRLTADLLPS